MSERDEELVARILREQGLKARVEDGWVYVDLPDERVLWIGAANGASLRSELFEEAA